MAGTRVFRKAVWIVMLFALVTSAAAQEAPKPPVPQAAPAQTVVVPPFGPGISLYVDTMDGGLDGFLRAELMKKKVPVNIVLELEDADYVMVGASSDRKNSWHEGWLSAQKDNSTGSVTIFDKTTKKMVWAEEAGDRSLWLGAMARGGPRKVASRIADRLKDHLKK